MRKPLNSVSVYQETRPANWLPMPEPADDEIYLLVNAENSVPIGLPFIVSCDGDYLVEIGTVQDGKFYPNTSKRFKVESFRKGIRTGYDKDQRQTSIRIRISKT